MPRDPPPRVARGLRPTPRAEAIRGRAAGPRRRSSSAKACSGDCRVAGRWQAVRGGECAREVGLIGEAALERDVYHRVAAFQGMAREVQTPLERIAIRARSIRHPELAR